MKNIGKFVIITKNEYEDLIRDRRTLKIIKDADAEKARKNKKRIDNEMANRMISSAIKELNCTETYDC